MLDTVSKLIVDYWIAPLIALPATYLIHLFKRYYSLDKAERQKEQDEHYKELFKESQKESEELINKCEKEHQLMNEQYMNMYKEFSSTIQQVTNKSKEEDNTLQERINSLNENHAMLKNGILSIQRRDFIHECKRLLEPTHVITLDEWEDLMADHEIYNSLGGNHTGDKYFNLVNEKFKSSTLGKNMGE